MMILTDLFGEDVSTSMKVLYVPNKDKINNKGGHIRSGAKEFSMIKICCVAVGQYDLQTRLGQFILDYKKLINALRVHNSKMYLFLMSVLPIGPRSDLHKFAVLKS